MDTNTPFEIHPFIGAGALAFGMSPSLVLQKIGPPDNISHNHLKQLVEFRSFMNLGYSENDKTLCHIGFGRQMNEVKLNGINLFLDPPEDVLEKLKKLDAEPYIYMGFIVFMNIGLTLTGFHDENISQKAAALFPKGAWDKRLGKMKRFRD